MTTRGRTRKSFRRAKKATYWNQSVFTHSPLASGSQVVTDISHQLIGTVFEPGGTGLRMILHAQFLANDTAGQANVGFGVIRVTADAAIDGSVPDPMQDFNQDWYYWWGRFGVSVTSGLVIGVGSNPTVDVDIRSARKLNEGWRLVLVTQTLVTSFVAPDIHFRVRTLWHVG